MTARTRRVVTVTLILLALAGTVIAALFIGAADTSSVVIMQIRAPRVITGVLIGAGLGVAGALLQGSLRNPLADPGLIGVSAGAALGAVAAAAIGAAYNSLAIALVATLVGLGALAVVTWIARSPQGRTEVVTLILGGVAITAFAAALLSVIVAVSDTAGSRSTTFWTTGSLALSTWPGVWVTLPFVLAGLVLAATIAGSLDVLSLGDTAARATGVPVDRVRMVALTASVLLVAAGVAVVGVIIFVGLVVPHAIRALMGPAHRGVILGSGLLGALLLLWADTVARTIVAPIELPLGVVTAVIGAPIFLYLLRKTRAQQGGWA